MATFSGLTSSLSPATNTLKGVTGSLQPAPSAPAPAPTPPPAPTTSPAVQTPTDATYQNQVNNLNSTFANQQAQLAGQRQQIEQTYGFSPQYASDPFTRANMLARAANQRFNATTNLNAIRGQLYSGVTSAERTGDQFAADQSMDAARRAYAQALQSNQDALIKDQLGLSEGLNSAQIALMNRLTASTPDASQQPAGPYDTTGYPSFGNGKPGQPAPRGGKGRGGKPGNKPRTFHVTASLRPYKKGKK